MKLDEIIVIIVASLIVIGVISNEIYKFKKNKKNKCVGSCSSCSGCALRELKEKYHR